MYNSHKNMVKKIKLRAYAKINLGLNVLDKRENGKHCLDSIMTTINLYDTVIAKKRKDGAINIVYRGFEIDKNADNAFKTALMLQKRYQTGGADIYIKKRIPSRAGLGGSSADAAAVAKCFRRLYGLPDIPCSLLVEIGSDTPFMYHGGTKRVKGIGETVEQVLWPKAYYAVITCPDGVSTKQVFDLYDQTGGDNCDIDKLLADVNGDRPFRLCNSLQKAAAMLNPQIEKALSFLRQRFENTVMTGSGSAVVGMEKQKAYLAKTKKLKNILPSEYRLYKT